MDRLTILDSAVRLLAIGQLLLIALVIGRGAAPRPIRLATVALLVCVCAYLILATPLELEERGPIWALIKLAAQATPMMLWVFAHILFERRLDRRLVAGGVIVLISCWIGFGIAGPYPNGLGLWLGILQRGTLLAMTVHAMLIAIRERGDDLIEKRRRLRVGFVIVVGILAVMVLVIEMISGFRHTGVIVTLPQALAMVVLHDTWFYWMHRALHLKALFRRTHATHHVSRTPTSWAAYSFAPIEAVFESVYVPAMFVVISHIAPMQPWAIFVFLGHQIARNAIGHSGFELAWSGFTRSRLTRWMTTTTHHDLHHTEGRYNFGLYFTWWDRLMGTEHPRYHARFESVVRPGPSQQPVPA